MSFSLWHWVIAILFIFVIGFPVARILGRLGLPKALVILAFIPIVNWIALWLLAYAKWPSIPSVSEIFE
jgi:membrane associated rhomboid family serine protease